MKFILMLLGMMMIINNLNFMFFFNYMFIMMFMYLIFNNYNLYWMNMYYFISTDKMSFMMSLLSIYIISLMLMVKNFKLNNFYLLNLLILLLFLLLSFNMMNYFLFYLFFEMSMIPTFILVMMWGYQPERINASLYMLFYTLFFSLPLLIILFIIFNKFKTLNFYFLNNMIMLLNYDKFIFYMFMLMAFLVKLPMYLLHLWLPKAHVEAPVTGSMILAGVMLKLGGYGIIRSMMMMMNFCLKFNNIIMSLALLGMFNLSLICLRQNDLKSLVAYSSVVHMMMMLIGLMMMNNFSINGSLLLMISHGLCSSALFYLVNLSYMKIKSRNLLINKGMIMIMPSLSMWWFLFCILNMAAPPSMNLLSELFILNCFLNWSMKMIFFMMLIMLLSMMYSLYLFSYSQHGSYLNNYKNYLIINNNNYLNLIMHWIPLNFYFLNMNFI
uniref:NADH-ubiquinone oxidoreductase chain 4 n=1 Tax=Gonatocerus sp. ZCS-2018 TaxID=2305128 RepID=A0A346PZ44_9HYME|nr:NADH dehydrogenase subunit 4 [Gonatocerus sp. ZCS-2018]